jgi:hypothetical protein
MNSHHNPGKHRALEDDLPYQAHDPIQAANRQSLGFLELWLKNGESQRPVQ